MKLYKFGAFVAFILATPMVSVQAQADAVRPGIVQLQTDSISSGMKKIGLIRASRVRGRHTDLYGTSLIVLSAAAAAAAAGAIVAITNNDSSPGAN
jgi:hypothetical protein